MRAMRIVREMLDSGMPVYTAALAEALESETTEATRVLRRARDAGWLRASKEGRVISYTWTATGRAEVIKFCTTGLAVHRIMRALLARHAAGEEVTTPQLVQELSLSQPYVSSTLVRFDRQGWLTSRTRRVYSLKAGRHINFVAYAATDLGYREMLKILQKLG